MITSVCITCITSQYKLCTHSMSNQTVWGLSQMCVLSSLLQKRNTLVDT